MKVALTKAEYEELLLTTSFEREELTALQDNFGLMQKSPQVVGKVCAAEFCAFLGLRGEQTIAQKLFEKLDFNKDGQLSFFDIVNSLDNFHQKQFKSKLKFYFELFCDQDKEVGRARLARMSKEIMDMFPHVVLPEGFLLGQTSPNPTKLLKHESAGGVPVVRRQSASAKENQDLPTDETLNLDEFYDHFEKVYLTLN